MSNGAANPKTPDIASNLAFNVFASLIAAALIYAGTWLAGRQVPDENALQFSFSEQRAGNLASWHIRLVNVTNVAFDVKITPPDLKIIRHKYSHSADRTLAWSGQIKKGEAMEAMFVIEDSTARLSPSLVQSIINVSYQERNSITGVIEPTEGELKESGVVGVTRAALLVFWFLLPITLAGCALPLAIWARKWWLGRQSSAKGKQ